MGRTTLASTNARIDALAESVATLVAALTAAQAATAPKQAPAKGKAQSAFFREVIVASAQAPREACGIHDRKACNRTFKATSAGLTNHVAKIES
jgi:hypothetical protein